MPSPLRRAIGWPVHDVSFWVFLAAVVLSLLRARDLPSVELGLGAAEVSVGPVDVALVATAALAVWRLWVRRSLRSRALVVSAAAFALLVLVTALPNGADALTSAGRLAELFALTLGAAAFVDSRERLHALLTLIVGFCVVAVSWGVVGFVTGGGGRQGSFLGEHDLAALGTLSLVVGLAGMYARSRQPSWVAVAIAAGGFAIALGASLASLLGLYLAAATLLALAFARRSLGRGAVLTTLAVVLAVSGATLTLRSGELGFIQEWFGPEPEQPGQYAASWSQRLIYAYVGGRVFLDSPLLGTGWHGELPPEEYAQYLPDARSRFPDQPPPYFPQADATFIPQQAYDQILFELGLVGAALFALVAFLASRAAVRVGLRGAREPGLLEQGLVPAGWLAGMAGALAGAALFGGSPLASLLWLTLGVAAATPSIVMDRAS
jgi:O-Antigen ligase